MDIALEASNLARGNPTGVAIYGRRLIGELARIDAENRYVLCYRLSRWKHRRHLVRLPGERFRTKWIQEPLHPLFLNRVQVYHGLDARGVASGGCRKVLTVHDLYGWPGPGPAGVPPDRRGRRLAAQLQRADAVIAVSDSTRRAILHHLPAVRAETIRVIPLGVEAAFAPRGPGEIDAVLHRFGVGRPYLLYVGCLERRKNLLRLLWAYDRVQGRRAGRRCTLVLAGPLGEGAEEILAAMKGLPPGAPVRYLGYVPRSDLPALYAGAHVCVYPSLHEGFGLPVLEAMACGVAVVTSRTTSLPEVAGDAALTVDPTQVSEIAEAVEMLLDRPAQRAALGERGRRRAAAFSWERTARETLAVYRELGGDRGGR